MSEQSIETSKRVVRRMLKHHLAMAWSAFVDSILAARKHRTNTRAVIVKLQNLTAASAFASWIVFIDAVRHDRSEQAKEQANKELYEALKAKAAEAMQDEIEAQCQNVTLLKGQVEQEQLKNAKLDGEKMALEDKVWTLKKTIIASQRMQDEMRKHCDALQATLEQRDALIAHNDQIILELRTMAQKV